MNTSALSEEAVLETLRQVIDPEIGCNIVDLGLVYSVRCNDGKVTVVMTLTTPGCPMHESICVGAQNAILALEGANEAEVQLVWDPPWRPTMMSDAGRDITGIRT